MRRIRKRYKFKSSMFGKDFWFRASPRTRRRFFLDEDNKLLYKIIK